MRRTFALFVSACAGFGPWLFLFLGTLPLVGQSYQSSFSDVKFDRSTGPATFHGGVAVDAATGAASMSIPIGPGIGERGLKFRPTLSIRIAPQLAISTADEDHILFQDSTGYDWTAQTAVDTLYQHGFGSASFSPGSLDLGTLASTLDRKRLSYSLPGGGGGRVLGVLPPGVSPTTVQTLLTSFGYTSSSTVVGYVPTGASVPFSSRTSFIQMSSAGDLVVGLRAAGAGDPTTGLTDEVMDTMQTNPEPPLGLQYRWFFPRRMLVIHGDVAYEFHYVDHTYMTRSFPYLANSQKTQLYSGHYMLAAIRNRFGEYLDFIYDPDGIGYTATWHTGSSSGPSIRVQVVGTTSVPSGNATLVNSQAVTSATKIRITYQGISGPISTYLLEVSHPEWGTSFSAPRLGPPSSAAAVTGPNGQRTAEDMTHFDSANLSLEPLSLEEEATGQTITFQWTGGPASTWNGMSLMPTVLTQVSLPNQTISLQWQSYRFRQNYNPESWAGITPSSAPGRPTFCYGVSKVTDSDGNQIRTTSHTRVLPSSNWLSGPSTNPPLDQWVDTSFYDAITLPDGSIQVHRFVEPPTSNATAGATGMQNLAFIKTLEREVRYYTPGADWQADLSVTNPASSIAYKWVINDRFDVRTVGAPDGAMGSQSVPYPTRMRTWDKESHVLTTVETTDWDSSAYGWRVVHHLSAVTSSPSFSVDYLSLAQQGKSYSAYSSSGVDPTTDSGVERETDRTFSTNVSQWLISRPATEVSMVLHDSTGYLAPGVGLPDVQPSVNKTYNPAVDRVDAVDVVGSDGQKVTTQYTYKGTTGLSAIELDSAYLNSSGLVLSGQLGVSSYVYDGNGYLSSISQKPNPGTTLTVGQTQDEIGRPLTQRDMNGEARSYAWDPAGRLSSITPPDGEERTAISYDPDFRGITVTRGLQVQGYRYNGFGELILEKRCGPNGSWSHKVYGYDTMGRKTGETVWLPGDGTTDETKWAASNLTQASTSTIPGKTLCKQWGYDASGNPVCLNWVTYPVTTTSTPALYVGMTITYDGRGRVISTVDANNLRIDTAYAGLTRTVTEYPDTSTKQTTAYIYDAEGRLVQVLDAAGHATQYYFDGGNRIKQVQQYGDNGALQTRTWSYNRLGWLMSLSQPESGITSYGAFTVAGHPTVTNYNGRSLTMTPDWMGRPLNVFSSASGDTSVSQTFSYDTAPGGKGRIASSTDGAVTTSYIYGAMGGRLSNLVTSVPVQGTIQTFTQTFAYDAYGNRTSGGTGHATWTQTYTAETGLPNLLNYGNALVASTPWSSWDPLSWMPKLISYGNGVKSAFSYDTDQTRLTQILHSPASGGPFAQWVYHYDGCGNMIREDDLLTGSWDQFGYDSLNRLQSALVASPTYGDQLQQFAYDAFGNRTSSVIQNVTGWSGARGASIAYVTASSLLNDPNRHVVNAAFNATLTAQKNQIPPQTASGVPTGATYDAQGNLTQIYATPGDSSTQLSMIYDALGRVIQVGNTKNNQVEKYQYTADGLRTLIEVYSGSALQTTRVNLHDDAHQLVSQYEKAATGTLAWKRDIIYLGTREAAEFDSAGMHVTQVDRVGSPRVVTGPSGSLESLQKYLPYGELLERHNFISTAITTAKGFTNHEQTDVSGLIYMQARFYVPWFGKFASPDPARDQYFEVTQSWNIYSYVRNNPVMDTDPTGMTDPPKSIGSIMGSPGMPDPTIAFKNDEAKRKAEEACTTLPSNQNGTAVERGVAKAQFSLDRVNPLNNSDETTTGRAFYAEGQATAGAARVDVGVAKGEARLISSQHFDLTFVAKALSAEGQATLRPIKTGESTSGKKVQQKLGIGVGLGGTASIAKAQFTGTFKFGPMRLELRGGFNAGVEAGFKAWKRGGAVDVGAIFKAGFSLYFEK